MTRRTSTLWTFALTSLALLLVLISLVVVLIGDAHGDRGAYGLEM